MEMYITKCTRDSQWELKPVTTTGWDAEAGGKGVQVRGDVGEPVTNSC